MKRLLLCVLATMPFVGFPQTSGDIPRLTGIVNVDDLKLAIIQSSSPPKGELALREGQKDGNIEVITIDSTNRIVSARVSGDVQPHALSLANSGSATNYGVPGLILEEARLQTVLNLLGEFSERTILQHPGLPDIKFSVAGVATNRTVAAQILKSALLEKRIAVVPDGPRFLLVVPKEMISVLHPRAARLATANTASVKAELLPPRSIHFTAAPLANVLMIYAEFLGGKLDGTGGPLRDGKVVLVMQTALTKEECLYAFETLVGWQGVKLVPSGDGLFKAISTAQSENSSAPK